MAWQPGTLRAGQALTGTFRVQMQAVTVGQVITKKPVTPTEMEKRNNPASRSAKLRCLERSDES